MLTMPESAQSVHAPISAIEKLTWLDRWLIASHAPSTHAALPAPITGGYAQRIDAIAQRVRANAEALMVTRVVGWHLRAAFQILDDLIDEDRVRNHAPAYWVIHGIETTIQRAALDLAQARQHCPPALRPTFEARLGRIVAGARLELILEQTGLPDDRSARQAAWRVIVEKESSFRALLAALLGGSPSAIQNEALLGVAAQICDDGRSAQHGKDGRACDSDARLGRLTYMAAFDVTPDAADREGVALKTAILTGKEIPHDLACAALVRAARARGEW